MARARETSDLNKWIVSFENVSRIFEKKKTQIYRSDHSSKTKNRLTYRYLFSNINCAAPSMVIEKNK